MLDEGFSSVFLARQSAPRAVSSYPHPGHHRRATWPGGYPERHGVPQGPGQIWVGLGWTRCLSTSGWPGPLGLHLHPHKLEGIPRNLWGGCHIPQYSQHDEKPSAFFKHPGAPRRARTYRPVICTDLYGVPTPSSPAFNLLPRRHVQSQPGSSWGLLGAYRVPSI